MLAALAFTLYVGVVSTVDGVQGVAASVLQHVAVLLDAAVAVALLGALLWRVRLLFDHNKDGKVSWDDMRQTFAKHGGAASAAFQASVAWVVGVFGVCRCTA
jgi:hypothetical protein